MQRVREKSIYLIPCYGLQHVWRRQFSGHRNTSRGRGLGHRTQSAIEYPETMYEEREGMRITEGACLTILEANVILANIKSTFGQPTDGFLRVRGEMGKLYRDFPAIEKHW